MLRLVIFWVNQKTQWQFYFSCCSCLSIEVVQELDIVQSAKLLIVTATTNLLWNEPINDVVKKRLYFLVQFSKKGKASLQRSSSFFFIPQASIETRHACAWPWTPSFKAFTFAEGGEKKYAKVTEEFDEHFVPKRNIHERTCFNRRVQKEGETVEAFIRNLYKLAEHCERWANQRQNCYWHSWQIALTKPPGEIGSN